jgi:7-keto-8-aminopelargonate synthetase-like enzyme
LTLPKTNSTDAGARTALNDRLRARLEGRRRDGLFRELPEPIEDRAGVLDLRSNDVLRLSAHPRMIEAVELAANRFGVGSGASRLIAERMGYVRECEARFASFKGCERALFTPTGFSANLALLGALADETTLILLDKLSHASLLDGALLASTSAHAGATVRTFAHNDVERARTVAMKHIERTDDALVLIVSESVFSMDGDGAPVRELAALRDEINGSGGASAALILDEAHATGVLGETGAGGDELHGHPADATVATASKALGALGGIVCGSDEVNNAVVNLGRAFIYSTGVMPIQASAIDEAVRILRDEPERRERLQAISRHVRAELEPLGVRPFDVNPTPIVPIVLGETERARAAHERLSGEGILTSLIRPPTVATGSSRLRLTVHVGMSDGDVERVCAAVRSLGA